jgi:hypothetical protein
MKRAWKRCVALLLILLLTLGLCGCDALDDMREAQMQFDENGDVVYMGVRYQRLPESEYLSPAYGDMKYIYITEPDVPVLLSQILYETMLSISNDRNFLREWGRVCYCREELYESVFDQIVNGFEVAGMQYEYGFYDEEEGIYRQAHYKLTQAQRAVVYEVLETVEPVAVGRDWYINGQWYIYLYECSADGFFQREAMELVATEDSYTLILESGDQTLAYLVPSAYKAVFEQILSPYVDAHNSLIPPGA